MFITDGLDIKIPAGDTAAVPFIFYTEDDEVETPYMLHSGEYAELSVRPVKGAEPVLVKAADGSGQQPDGSLTICFSARDTDIGRGRYIYTVTIKNAGGTAVDTWLGVEPAAGFEIL